MQQKRSRIAIITFAWEKVLLWKSCHDFLVAIYSGDADHEDEEINTLIVLIYN